MCARPARSGRAGSPRSARRSVSEGGIFATLWDENRMNVMLDEGGILTAVESEPKTCAEAWWGKRSRGRARGSPARRSSNARDLALRSVGTPGAEASPSRSTHVWLRLGRASVPGGAFPALEHGRLPVAADRLEPSTHGPSSGWGNFVCSAFSWMPYELPDWRCVTSTLRAISCSRPSGSPKFILMKELAVAVEDRRVPSSSGARCPRAGSVLARGRGVEVDVFNQSMSSW